MNRLLRLPEQYCRPGPAACIVFGMKRGLCAVGNPLKSKGFQGGRNNFTPRWVQINSFARLRVNRISLKASEVPCWNRDNSLIESRSLSATPDRSTTGPPVQSSREKPAAGRSAPGGPAAIGGSLVLTGTLTGQEDVYIDGTLEGTIELRDSDLTIGPNGNINAGRQARRRGRSSYGFPWPPRIGASSLRPPTAARPGSGG